MVPWGEIVNIFLHQEGRAQPQSNQSQTKIQHHGRSAWCLVLTHSAPGSKEPASLLHLCPLTTHSSSSNLGYALLYRRCYPRWSPPWYWPSHNIKSLQQPGWTFTNILGSLQGLCSCHVKPSFNFSPGPLSTYISTTTKVWLSLKASPGLTKHQASAVLHDPHPVITPDILTHVQVQLPEGGTTLVASVPLRLCVTLKKHYPEDFTSAMMISS